MLAAISETGPNIGLVFIVIVAVALPVMAIIDALSWPAWAFYGAGSNKTAWVIVLAVATVLGIGVSPRRLVFPGSTARRQAAGTRVS